MNQKIVATLNNLNRYIPFFVVLVTTSLIMLASLRTIYRTSDFTAAIISNDLSCIAHALTKLHTSCTIVSFEREHSPLDFLTMPSLPTFAKNKHLTVAQPEKWRGPYLTEIPTVQGKAYEICRAYDGYFLIPGRGVQLPNGLVMGVDLIITPEILVAPLLSTGKALNYKGEQLAKKLDLCTAEWHKTHVTEQEAAPLIQAPRPAPKKSLPSSTLHAFKIHLPKKIS